MARSSAKRNSRGFGLPADGNADLDETEAEPGERSARLAALVEAGGETDRRGKREPGDGDGEPRIVHRGQASQRVAGKAEARAERQRQPVRGFGVEPEQQRPQQG